MKIDVIAEPELEFGGGGMHIDIRFGLRDFGPLDRTDVDSPHEISLGFVGTNETIEAAQAWLAKCQKGVPAKASPRTRQAFSIFVCKRRNLRFRLTMQIRWEILSESHEYCCHQQKTENEGSPSGFHILHDFSRG